MDLSRFDTREKSEAGVTVPLVINDEMVVGDDGEPVTFTIKGAADEKVQAHLMATGRDKHATPKEAREVDMKLARLAVVGWSDNFAVEGDKLKFSAENIERVFANPVVRRAVLARIFSERLFTKGA
ncbi:hypothetical protein [Profundibacterium mesophilum]|uniref:Uncharacterized protein n=1 Tax=Profundibacterium mesophilum KAUST100406-0324 TaxID=1037889 RepID=A0A921NT64_9RHOB|nr:hypothetical protein [Profundibacterium mesophilum]KAF0675070.1 hypothetical protein PMES_02591 [Profundibacterium mesophilum KAUST100406-0324]